MSDIIDRLKLLGQHERSLSHYDAADLLWEARREIESLRKSLHDIMEIATDVSWSYVEGGHTEALHHIITIFDEMQEGAQ